MWKAVSSNYVFTYADIVGNPFTLLKPDTALNFLLMNQLPLLGSLTILIYL